MNIDSDKLTTIIQAFALLISAGLRFTRFSQFSGPILAVSALPPVCVMIKDIKWGFTPTDILGVFLWTPLIPFITGICAAIWPTFWSGTIIFWAVWIIWAVWVGIMILISGIIGPGLIG